MTRKSFKNVNKRRCELIDKEFAVGLTDEEKAELDKAQDWVGEWLSTRLPPIDTTILEKIEKQARIDGIDLESPLEKEAS